MKPRHYLIGLAVCATSVWLAQASLAAKAVKGKIQVQADSVTYNDELQTAVFTGHVRFDNQGMLLQAGQVEVIVDAQGYTMAQASNHGGVSVLVQQVDPQTGLKTQARAQQAIYDARAHQVVLQGNAHVQRLTARGQLQDEVRGPELVYDTVSQQYSSEGRTVVRVKANPNNLKPKV